MEIASIIKTLDETFEKANQTFFNGELERPVITVSPDMTAGAYGWFTTWRAWQKDGEEGGYYEINLTAEYLNRPIADSIGTLLHEMAHLSNAMKGIQDCSRGGTYHNKKFKVEAEKCGLTVSQTEKYGWSKTTLNEEGKLFLESLGLDGFGMRRVGGAKTAEGGKKSSSRKYVCPECGMIIRATKEVKILCGECSTEEHLVMLELE